MIFTFLCSAYLKQVLKENKKFIVFAHHHSMLDAIDKCLTKQKVEFIRIDGSTRSDLRAVIIKYTSSNVYDTYLLLFVLLAACGKVSNKRILSRGGTLSESV